MPLAEGEPGEERGKDELAPVAAEHAQEGRRQRDEDIEQSDTEVEVDVVALGLHGLGQVHGLDGHPAAALHAHEHRTILGAQGRKQHVARGLAGADDDMLARTGMATRGEQATVVRVHGNFHSLPGAGRFQDPRCEARDIDAQPARTAGGARQLAVFSALPAVGRQASGRRRSGGGVAAVVEGYGLLRVRALR